MPQIIYAWPDGTWSDDEEEKDSECQELSVPNWVNEDQIDELVMTLVVPK